MQGINNLYHRLLVCLIILSLLPGIPLKAGNKRMVYFVSSSMGNDKNPGTKQLPKRTIKSVTANNKDGMDIRLKCGDIFFENIYGLSNSIIRSYGRGRLPVLCGFKVLKNMSAWHHEGNLLWRLDMKNEENFAGFSIQQARYKKRINDIGCIYDPSHDKIYGHIVSSKDSLKKMGDIFTSEKFKSNDIDEETFRYLYFYCDSTLEIMRDLCFSTYEFGISCMKCCQIKNIAVVGFACHGMCDMDECTIDGCFIDIIGGAIQTGTPYWVRYGNGIEFWISKKSPSHNIVKNCTISRTYDCGVTIQGNGNDFIADATDLHFVHNKFYHCRQAFEHFLNPNDTTCHPRYVDCEFTGNVCYEMGENEFTSPEQRDANILSYDKEAKDIKVEKNVFYGSSYYCGRREPLGMKNNKVYLYKGQYLCHFHGTTTTPSIYVDGDESIRKYRKWSGDNSKIIIVEEKSIQNLPIMRSIKKRIDTNRFNLNLEM